MNWPKVQLKDIANIVGGSTPRRNTAKYWGGEINWLTPTDLPAPGAGIALVRQTASTITEEGLESCSAQLLPPGTVTFSSRATIGKIGIVGNPLATNQGFANFIPKGPVDSWFLAYSLLHHTSRIAKLAGSTTFKEVAKGPLKEYYVSLPPLSEQRRIVGILSQADALRKKRVEADANVQRILPALFCNMFGNPSQWRPARNVLSLGSLVKLASGATPSKKVPRYWRGAVPWVSPKDMKRDFLADSRDHVSEDAVAETNLHLIEPGAILIVVRGMILARTVPVALATGPLTINQDMKAMLIRNDRVTPAYLFAALKCSGAALQSKIRTAAHGTRKIDTDELLALPIKIPEPNALQRFDEGLRAFWKSMEGSQERGHLLESLFMALLHRAFTGDLTAKWREAHMKELLQEMEQRAKILEASHE